MEMETYLRFVLALVFVLALIGLLAWVARRYGFGGRPTGRAGRTRRLDIVETRAVDGKRRLVLLRRDDVEHLVLTGPNSEILIERGITGSVLTDAGEGYAPATGTEIVSGTAGKSHKGKSASASSSPTVFRDEVTKRISKAKRPRAAKA